MTTKVEGLVRNLKTGFQYTVDDTLEADTGHQWARYLVSNRPGVPLSILDTIDEGAKIDQFGTHDIETQVLDIKTVSGKYIHQNGIIYIFGTVDIVRHTNILTFEHYRSDIEHVRVIYTQPKILLSNPSLSE
jgi:hypothetical protein